MLEAPDAHPIRESARPHHRFVDIIASMEIDELEEIVSTVAAAEVMARFGRVSKTDITEKTSAFDVVTAADISAEKEVTKAVLARWPGTTIIGEETAGETAELRAQLQSDSALVLDPLDGTKNFVSGLPLFAMMAAIMRKGRIVGGIIHDPVTRSSAMATAGGGAWLRWENGETQRLRVADPAPLSESEAIAGVRFVSEPLRSTLSKNLSRLAGHTWFRCAGHEYRLAAAGHVHLLCYHRLMPWDHAPGWLIHREAGGYSAHFDGSPFDPGRMEGGLLCAPDADSWREARSGLIDS